MSFKIKISIILFILTILFALITDNSSKITLNEIAYFLLCLVGIYISVFVKGIFIGNFDVGYTRAINIFLGVFLFIMALLALFSPLYR